MPLRDVELTVQPGVLPDDIRELIREAESRIADFVEARLDEPVPGFVPCDFTEVYWGLARLARSPLLAGTSFCEWGSGFGVVTLLAASLGFEANGIEIEQDLVEEARRLAEDFSLEAEFATGTFIPREAQSVTDAIDFLEGPDWLASTGPCGYEELGLDPGDFDLIFAYPWPGEEHVLIELFDQVADSGALFLTFNGLESLSLRRKVGPACRR